MSDPIRKALADLSFGALFDLLCLWIWIALCLMLAFDPFYLVRLLEVR